VSRGERGPLARMRALCLALPEAREKLTWDVPTFRVREKMFALCGSEDARLTAWLKAPPGAQESLVAYDPRRYFVPPYVGRAGWIGVYLDGRVPWAQVAALVEQSWRLVAPKKLCATRARRERAAGS
jgi:predicted DNA-binding protein (MmcQ/YjbR family)